MFCAKLEPLDQSEGNSEEVCVTQLHILRMGWIQPCFHPQLHFSGVHFSSLLVYTAGAAHSAGHQFLAATSM